MEGLFDIHCHIIPNVDDGSDSMDTTMKILQMEYEDGVRTVFATSHFRRGMFEPSMEKYWKQFELVREAASKMGITVLPGCEFHANMEMVETLRNWERPTMGDSRCVLVEFKNGSPREFIRERCYTLMTSGYQPIIAHAERYECIRKDLDFLEDLVDMGAYIQFNCQSITGDDGFFMKQYCKKAIQRDLVHFIGTDAHNVAERKPTIGKCVKYLEKLMGEEYVEAVFIDNPQSLILEDK